MASVQDKAASDGTALKEVCCHKITFANKGGFRQQDEYSLLLCGIHTAYKMKIITPQVNQTGEVRLLSKLLNQKVDIVCCMCSRGRH